MKRTPSDGNVSGWYSCDPLTDVSSVENDTQDPIPSAGETYSKVPDHEGVCEDQGGGDGGHVQVRVALHARGWTGGVRLLVSIMCGVTNNR